MQHKFLRYLSFKTQNPMNKFNHNFKPISRKFTIFILKSLHDYHDMGLILFKDINCPELNEIFKTKPNPYSWRASATLIEKIYKRNKSFYCIVGRLQRGWNNLPLDMRGVADLQTFKKNAFIHICTNYPSN